MIEIVKAERTKLSEEHTCWGCCETFDAGAKLLCETLFVDGKLKNIYFCSKCEEKIQNNSKYLEKGVALGELQNSDD